MRTDDLKDCSGPLQLGFYFGKHIYEMCLFLQKLYQWLIIQKPR